MRNYVIYVTDDFRLFSLNLMYFESELPELKNNFESFSL